MIERYNKRGGFLQLLAIFETCGKTKKITLLENIEKDSLAWAEELKNKALTVDRIFAWPDEEIAKIANILPDFTLSVAVQGLPKEHKEKLINAIEPGQKARLLEHIEYKKANAGEINSAVIRLIKTLREYIQERYFKHENFDPGVFVQPSIEENLKKYTQKVKSRGTLEAVNTVPNNSTNPNELRTEIKSLEEQNQQLLQTVQNNKSKINHLRKKLAA